MCHHPHPKKAQDSCRKFPASYPGLRELYKCWASVTKNSSGERGTVFSPLWAGTREQFLGVCLLRICHFHGVRRLGGRRCSQRIQRCSP
ncbi:hypothetical protein GDO78_022371 [Eleutherodactylus coqui]|uniref:Uncharacterized protein n=1 Tax=Eleutherodactylus coqui TaxID=57060 RepID=A0A8J6E2P4_ELECQ|nr:hypothetical protein GDO78_022371 [Eleutherodactylus coqui]